MSTAANKALVRRFIEERWNQRNLDIHDELVAPSLDIKAEKEAARSAYAIFANSQMTILDLLAEGDQVAVHWRFTATHQGDYLGVAATGKPLTYQGMALLRIAGDKIGEDVAYWDNLSILQQVGAFPVPAYKRSAEREICQSHW